MGKIRLAIFFYRQGGCALPPDNNFPTARMPGSATGHPLGQIFHRHVDETISDQQVDRVLAPVLAMVKLGGLTQARARPEKRRVLQFPYLLTATAMVAVVTVAVVTNVVNMRIHESSDHAHVGIVEHIAIPHTSYPLTGPAIIERIDSGFRGDMREIRLAIADMQGHLLGVAAKEEGGIFRFDLLPDGDHKAMALLPYYLVGEDFRGIKIGSLNVTNGSAQLLLSEGLENFWEGADIQVWLTGS